MRAAGNFLWIAGATMAVAMGASLFLIEGAKPIFILFQFFSMILILFALNRSFESEFDNLDNMGRSMPRRLVKLFLIFFILLTYLVSEARILEGLPLGSLLLVLIAALIAGLISFQIMEPYSAIREWVPNGEKDEMLSVFLIFMIGFALRAYFMGRGDIPIGNDAPMYLLLAVKGHELPLWTLVSNGFAFSGDLYQDTINFSQMWLAFSLYGLDAIGLGPLYISKLVIPLLSALSIIGIYFLGRALVGARFGLAGSMVFAILPTEVLFTQLYKEIIGELFLIISLALIIMTFKSGLRIYRGIHIYLCLLLLSVMILAKSAITTLTYFSLFSVSLATFWLVKSKILPFKKAAVIFTFICIITTAVLTKEIIPLGYFASRMVEFSYLSVPDGARIHPYGYFALPIMALTNIIPVSVASFYIFKSISCADLMQNEIKIMEFSLPLVIVIGIVSLFLTTFLGYNLFPTSLFYYSIRLAVYSGIPLALLAGAFLLRARKYNLKLFYIISLLLLFNFFISLDTTTTIHSSLLSPAIDDHSYKLLESLDGPGPVLVIGNFSIGEYGLQGESLGYKNWIDYFIYKNIGIDPIYINSSSGVGCWNGKAIKYENGSISLLS